MTMRLERTWASLNFISFLFMTVDKRINYRLSGWLTRGGANETVVPGVEPGTPLLGHKGHLTAHINHAALSCRLKITAARSENK